MIELDRVTRRFEGKRQVVALDDVSLTIARGEMVSIIGPSGSGKSTLLNLIGGLDRPTSGEDNVDGEALGTLSDENLTRVRRDKIGFIFQFHNLLPFLDGHRKGVPHAALYWRTGPNGAIRKGDWKLLLARREGSDQEIVRLYDVAHDPAETRDLSGEKPALVEELRAAWTKWNAGLAPARTARRTVVTEHQGDTIRWQI